VPLPQANPAQWRRIPFFVPNGTGCLYTDFHDIDAKKMAHDKNCASDCFIFSSLIFADFYAILG
jgi:hypothetical protein